MIKQNIIVSSYHRGQRVTVLMEKVDGKFAVVDINGYSPSNFPPKITARSLNAVTPRSGPRNIPVLDFSIA